MADHLEIHTAIISLETFTVANAPDATAYPDGVIKTSNGAAGNPILAFSNGTNWLRSDTGAAIAAA